MPAYNFKEQFAAKVESGEKTQTVRKTRKYPTRRGDILHLYTGMRTKKCRLLGVGKCTAVAEIDIPETGTHLYWDGVPNFKGGWMADRFYKAEGFESWKEMIKFFKDLYGLPFEGEVIYWELMKEDYTK